MATMTTEERIAELDAFLDAEIGRRADMLREVAVNRETLVIACELRALRLMLRDEIREAAWPLKQWAEAMSRPEMVITFPEGMTAEQRDEFVRRWKEVK